jgi:aspartyl-tRNA(Asn)/glutamyl-tRNA(Gln) amidotransferase subunit C
MPAEFSRDQVAAIAALANLQLDPAEIELFARQLRDILAYAEEVQRADTAGVPPTAAVGAGESADRDDRVLPSLDIAASLDGGFFKVPRVIG